MAVNYRLRFLDSFGNRITDVSLNDLSRLEFSRAENQVGSLEAVLPPVFDPSLIKRDYRILLIRTVDGYPGYIEGATQWFIEAPAFSTDSALKQSIRLACYDNNYILSTHIVNSNDESDRSLKYGYADDVMKSIVRQQFGISESHDDYNQLDGYENITGVDDTNTDSGMLYIVINYSDPNYSISIYKDSEHASLVAHTADYTTIGAKAIVADGGSGLGGTITVTATIAATTVHHVMVGFLKRNLISNYKRFNPLSVDADISASLAYVDMKLAYLNVVEALNQVASAANSQFLPTDPTKRCYLAFDVINPTEKTFKFMTYVNQRGVDRGKTSGANLKIADTFGNVFEPTLLYNYADMATVVYVSGEGEADVKMLTEAEDEELSNMSIFGRKEAYLNVGGVGDITNLQNAANDNLRRYRPRITFQAKIVDSPNARYGIDFNYGDIITVGYKGKVYDCHVSGVHITYEGGRESIELTAVSQEYL